MPWAAAAAAAAAVTGAVIQSNASKKAAASQASAAGKATDAQMQMFYDTDANLSPWRTSGTVALEEINRLLGLSGPPGIRKPTREDAARVAEEGHRNSFGGKGYTADSNRNLIAAAEQRAFDQLMAEYDAKVAALPQTQQPDPLTSPLTKPFGMEDFQESPAYQFNLQQGQKAIEKAAAARKMFYAPQTLQDISKFSQGMASNEFMNAYNMYNKNQQTLWDRLYALSGSGQNAAAQSGAFGTQVGGQIGENIIGAGNAQAAGQVGQANAWVGAGNNAYNAYMMNQILQQNQRPTYTGVQSNPGLTGSGDLNSMYG